jgi:hypothetical protein
MKKLLILSVAAISLLTPAALQASTVAGHTDGFSIPLNVTLQAGDTLYVRFAITDTGNFPSVFNALWTRFNFDSAKTDPFQYTAHLYDDSDNVAGTLNYSFIAGSVTEADPRFVDESRGGVKGIWDGSADLSSYLDGTGMVSLNWEQGSSANLTDLRVNFGSQTSSSGSYSSFPCDYWYSVNSIPTPEPATLLLTVLGFTGLLAKRRRLR